jgi:hypothetical protein
VLIPSGNDGEIGAASLPALPQLIAALKDDNPGGANDVRAGDRHARERSEAGDQNVHTAGSDRPDDWFSVPLRDMRRAVCWALGEIGPDAREALPLMKEWSRFYRVRWVSAEAIAKIEGRPAPPMWRDVPKLSGTR